MKNKDEMYKEAMKLALDLAEKSIIHEMQEMYMVDNNSRAQNIRKDSENNINSESNSVQRFRSKQYELYGAIYSLLEGFNGYKIVKIEECD